MAAIKVFVSSVSRDFTDTRAQVIHDLRNGTYEVNAMEEFGAQPDPPIEVCLRELRRADVVILIVGPCYGSLLPENISYTHKEFREARELRIPVLAFRVPDRPTLSGDEVRRLADFLTEVGSVTTYDSVLPGESPDRLSPKILAALANAQHRGALGSRYSMFQKHDEFFASQLTDATAVFNHKGMFVGRDDQLHRLLEFMAGSDPVLILSAPGGSGKSRLLLEAAAAATARAALKVLFVDAGATWSADDINRLPRTPTVLIFDDAHRRHDLDRLIAACRTQNEHVRFIVSCRPSAIEIVRPLLTRTINSTDPTTIDLPLLAKEDAQALAEYHLGTGLRHLAERLVKLADCNPLVIGVGARCIAKRLVAPEVLERTPEEFRLAVLDRLLDDPGLNQDATGRKNILTVISTIGPITTESAELVTAFAEHIDMPEHQLRGLLANLERSGFLMRRGRLVRVSPDVLADHLLYRAAVDANGAPTGFVEAMIKAFGTTSLENILTNAAELDWRAVTTATHEPVLATTWRDLRNLLPRATHRERADLLAKVKRAAIFAPQAVLDIAEWISDNRQAPPDEQLTQWGLEDKPEMVDESLTDTFAFIAGHPAFTKRCLGRLWTFAAADTRPTNSIPEHPRRLIEQLLKYERDRFWQAHDGVQVQTINFLSEQLLNPRRTDDAAWAVSLLGSALDRLGEQNESTRRQMSLRSFSLAPFVAQLAKRRETVLACFKALAFGKRTGEAGAAVREVAKLLTVPWGPYGQDLTAEQVSAWRPEAESAIMILRDVATSAPFDVVRFIARTELRRASRRQWPEISQQLSDAFEASPPSANEDLYYILIGAPHPEPRYDYRAQEARIEELCEAAAVAFWQKDETPQPLVAALLNAVDALREVAATGDAGRLVHAIVRTRPEHSDTVVRSLIASGRLGWGLLRPALLGIHDRQPNVAEALLLELTNAPDDELRALALDAMQWIVIRDRDIRLFLEAARRLAMDISPIVRCGVPQVLRRLREKAPVEAIKILVSIEWQDDLSLGETVLEALHPEYGLDPKLLTSNDIDIILGRIAKVHSLDGQAHNVLDFIGFASKKRPKQTVQMLLERIAETDRKRGKRRKERWIPLPYNGHGLSLPGVAKAPDYTDLIRLIRDAVLKGSASGRFWLPELFSIAVADMDTALALLGEWSGSGEAQKISGAACLLRGFGHGLVFSAHEFVADLLDAAAAMGHNCLRDVNSQLSALAVGGTFSGIPGEPMPRHLNDKAEAQKLSQAYTARKPVTEFYRSLVEHAETSIKRDQQSWEEEGDE